MKAIRAVFAAGLVGLSTVAEATPILGSGAASCGTWNADRQRNQTLSQQSQAWVLGFLTAYNLYKPSTGNVSIPTDTRKLMIWIDNYCDANPLKDIVDAAKALIDEFEGRAPQ
jgi:hypothetical protein